MKSITFTRNTLSSFKGVLDNKIPSGIYPNNETTNVQLNEHLVNILTTKYLAEEGTNERSIE